MNSITPVTLVLITAGVALLSAIIQIFFQYLKDKLLEWNKKRQELLSSLKQKQIENYTKFIVSVLEYESSSTKNPMDLKKPFCELLLSSSAEQIVNIKTLIQNLEGNKNIDEDFEKIITTMYFEIHWNNKAFPQWTFSWIYNLLKTVQQFGLKWYRMEEQVLSRIKNNNSVRTVTNQGQKSSMFDGVVELNNWDTVYVIIHSAAFFKTKFSNLFNKHIERIKQSYPITTYPDRIILISVEDSDELISKKLFDKNEDIRLLV